MDTPSKIPIDHRAGPLAAAENSFQESPSDLIEIAEEITELFRQGKKPRVEDFLLRFPQWDEELRQIVPLIGMMEQVGHGGLDGTVDGNNLETPFEMPMRLGDFELMRRAGQGGMGTVFEARQVSLDRLVAVKVLTCTLVDSRRFRERFEREARSAARLHHSNIVPVFGFGDEGDVTFYVMQLIRGASLDQVVECLRQPDCTVRDLVSPEVLAELSSEETRYHTIARLGIEAASALHYAHTMGVIHRDIKPANLIIDDQGRLWITDFGLAKATQDENITEQNDVLGTIRYLSPERFRGEADGRSDLYSLALTLFELLTLQQAYGFSDRTRLIQQVAEGRPRPLRQSNPHIPEPLALILDKCLAIEPKDRYQTGEAFAEDLQRFLNDEPILARPDTLPLRFQRWCRHHPAVACLTGLLLATVVGLIAMQRVVVRERDRYQLALADSLVAQSRFQRLTGRTGQRLQGLSNLSQAATLNNQGDYAIEALRAMVLPDLENDRRWTGSHESFAVDSVALASDFSRYIAYQPERAEILTVPDPSAASRTLETMALPPGRPILAKFSPRGRWALVSMEMEPHQHRLFVFESDPEHQGSRHEGSRHAVVEVDAAVNFAADIDATDGVLIAGVAVDGGWELRSCDLQTTQIVCRVPLPGAPFHVRCEKEGRRAAISMPHANRVWVVDIFTGQVLHELEYGEDIYAVAWHPAGNHLAVGLGFDIELVELSPSLRSTQVLKGHTWMVHQLYFDASGAFLASHSLREGTSRIWDLRKRRQVLEVEGHVRGFQQTTVPGDIGTKPRLALVDATQISIHTLWADQEYQVFGAADGRSSNCWRTVSHPHHALLISAGSEGLMVWHRESGELLARAPGASVYTLSIDRDTDEVLTAGPAGVQSWSIEWDESQRVCTVSPPRVAQSQFADWNAASPVFAYHRSADGETRLVALQSPPRLLLLDAEHRLHRELETTDNVPYAALSPDGRWVASGNDEQAGLTVWNRDEASTGQRLDADGVSAQVFFSPDSRRLLACSNDRFTMFETGTWKKCWERTTSRVVEGTAAFSNDGRYVALSMGLGDVRLVKAESGEEVLTLDCSQDQVNILNLQFLTEPWRLCLSCGPAGLRVWNLRRAGEWMQEHRIAWPLP